MGDFTKVLAFNVKHIVVQCMERSGAVQHAQPASTEMRPLRRPVPGGHFVGIQPLKTHHASVVGVVSTNVGDLVAVVNAWYAGNAHDVGHEKPHFGVAVGPSVPNVTCPSLELHVLVDIERAIRQRRETWAVLVPRDVAHQMMGPVRFDARFIRGHEVVP